MLVTSTGVADGAVVFYFLLPSAFAVPIHWLLLRGAKRAVPSPSLGGEG